MKNFTTSWGDGSAFCALVANWRPDVLDFDTLDRSQPLKCLQIAFRARDKLGIMSLLDAEDVLEYQEQKSIQTQLAEYYNVLSKSSARGYKNALLHDAEPQRPRAVTAEVSCAAAEEAPRARAATSAAPAKKWEPVQTEVRIAKPNPDTPGVTDHNGNRLYGLDADLFLRQEAKRDRAWERKVLEWVEAVLEEPLVDATDIVASFKSGVVLCLLANKLKPDAVKKFEQKRLNAMSERANIEVFLKACLELRVPPNELFSCADLHSAKNPGSFFPCQTSSPF